MCSMKMNYRETCFSFLPLFVDTVKEQVTVSRGECRAHSWISVLWVWGWMKQIPESLLSTLSGTSIPAWSLPSLLSDIVTHSKALTIYKFSVWCVFMFCRKHGEGLAGASELGVLQRLLPRLLHPLLSWRWQSCTYTSSFLLSSVCTCLLWKVMLNQPTNENTPHLPAPHCTIDQTNKPGVMIKTATYIRLFVLFALNRKALGVLKFACRAETVNPCHHVNLTPLEIIFMSKGKIKLKLSVFKIPLRWMKWC